MAAAASGSASLHWHSGPLAVSSECHTVTVSDEAASATGTEQWHSGTAVLPVAVALLASARRRRVTGRLADVLMSDWHCSTT